MDNKQESHKRGYLKQDFQFFHIADQTDLTFEFHYHEFNKIIIFLSGNVTYLIEGKSYKLKPWDILLINNHDVHKPIINTNETYDRIILWIDNDFISKHSNENCDLTTCFKLAGRKSFSLIRLEKSLQDQLKQLISSLEQSVHSEEFGSKLLSNAIFLQFLIYLNRIYLNQSYIYDQNALETDTQIEGILQYVKDHLGEDLSVESIANHFYLSKHYLMHKFKLRTGYTLHNYILKKRLFYATELIQSGLPIIKASEQSGFRDYSTFLRAFRKTFHCSPKEFFQKDSL
ncbi:transcriptional regulator of rhamnose utilization, AraC family [Lachnospiraceae bacterium KM106-2]|nr:transcriptional regulator of rhamnose utilization, AraC family [Lachnospiraceae bacterium KM106-2]